MSKNIIFIILSVIIISCTAKTTAYAEVSTFEDCAKAGNIIKRSLPAQCVTKDGKVFVDTKNTLKIPYGDEGTAACVDKCGDGACQELVCMAIGCPCAESPHSCPKDCHN